MNFGVRGNAKNVMFSEKSEWNPFHVPHTVQVKPDEKWVRSIWVPICSYGHKRRHIIFTHIYASLVTTEPYLIQNASWPATAAALTIYHNRQNLSNERQKSLCLPHVSGHNIHKFVHGFLELCAPRSYTMCRGGSEIKSIRNNLRLQNYILLIQQCQPQSQHSIHTQTLAHSMWVSHRIH